jgi:hypothetical protein
MEEKYNINEALKYYRYYAAFCENAIDAMEWYLDDYKITSQAKSITESRLLSLQLKAHMDKALDTYRELCDNGSCIRKYNIIMRKFIDPQGGADGRGKPFTNEQLADLFDCSEKTIKRDLIVAKQELQILFFGIRLEKGTE